MQMARIMGAVNIVMVGLEEDVAVRFLLPKSWGRQRSSTVRPKMWSRVAGKSAVKTTWASVIECSGANIALKQSIEMLRPNGEVVRVGMGFKPLDFSINDITAWNKSIIGHMAYDSTSPA